MDTTAVVLQGGSHSLHLSQQLHVHVHVFFCDAELRSTSMFLLAHKSNWLS